MPVLRLHPIPTVWDGAKGCAHLSEGTQRDASPLQCLCCFCPLTGNCFCGTMVGARSLVEGRCPCGLPATEVSAGHPQEG